MSDGFSTEIRPPRVGDMMATGKGSIRYWELIVGEVYVDRDLSPDDRDRFGAWTMQYKALVKWAGRDNAEIHWDEIAEVDLINGAVRVLRRGEAV